MKKWFPQRNTDFFPPVHCRKENSCCFLDECTVYNNPCHLWILPAGFDWRFIQSGAFKVLAFVSAPCFPVRLLSFEIPCSYCIYGHCMEGAAAVFSLVVQLLTSIRITVVCKMAVPMWQGIYRLANYYSDCPLSTWLDLTTETEPSLPKLPLELLSLPTTYFWLD